MRLMSIVLAVAVCGCAERTWIRTAPPGATVWVNDRIVGVSPVVYTADQREFTREQRYRIELPGYEPEEGLLMKRTSPGRIAGAVCSLGLSLAFRSVASFAARHDIALRRSSTSDSSPRSPIPSGLTLPAKPPDTTDYSSPTSAHPSATPTVAGSADDLEMRLRRLKEARDRGFVTEEEYRKTRARILEGL